LVKLKAILVVPDVSLSIDKIDFGRIHIGQAGFFISFSSLIFFFFNFFF
jgi:hypothetical protein